MSTRCMVNGKKVSAIKVNGKNIAKVMRNGSVIWEYVNANYLTLTAGAADSWVTFAFSSGTDVEYRVNSRAEASWETYTSATKVELDNGDFVQFRGTNVFTNSSNHFTMGGSIAASGSVTSLLDRRGADENVTLYNSCFSFMFKDCTALASAPTLPALTVKSLSYNSMFQGCTALATAPALPATTLNTGCYQSMFQGCIALTSAPALSAETTFSNCYKSMFSGCTSLATPPTISATALAAECYSSMFYGCSALTTAPEISVETLADNCYYQMFEGCSSLTTPPSLPATAAAASCYYRMFKDCTSLTTAPALPATTLANYCYYGMFWNCTSLTTAPSIEATTTNSTACGRMFYDCSSLVYVKTAQPDFAGCNYWLPDTNGTFHCTDELFVLLESGTRSSSTVPSTWNVVTDVGTNYLTFTAEADGSGVKFSWDSGTDVEYRLNSHKAADWQEYTAGTKIELADGEFIQFRGTDVITYMYSHFSMEGSIAASGSVTSLTDRNGADDNVTLTDYCYNYMFFDCSALTSAPLLPAKNMAKSCYAYMFYMCSELTSAPLLPAKNLAGSCYRCMFSGCTALTTAPYLPSMNLETSCYYSMFSGCINLTSVPELPATNITGGCYYAMFARCTNLTTAPIMKGKNLANSCYYQMFYECEALTTGPTLNVTNWTTWDQKELYYMFSGCTSLTSISTNQPNFIGCSYWLPETAGTFHCTTALKAIIEAGERSTSTVPSTWTIVDDVT